MFIMIFHNYHENLNIYLQNGKNVIYYNLKKGGETNGEIKSCMRTKEIDRKEQFK